MTFKKGAVRLLYDTIHVPRMDVLGAVLLKNEPTLSVFRFLELV